jgi:hypothetical protein
MCSSAFKIASSGPGFVCSHNYSKPWKDGNTDERTYLLSRAVHDLIIRSSIDAVQIRFGRMLLPQIASGICRMPIDDRIRLVDIRIGVILVDLGQPSIIPSVESRGDYSR